MPNGIPRYVRCYDSHGPGDRYTVVFTRLAGTNCPYLGMNAEPYHPQGIGMHGESPTMIDRPTSSHLGKRIKFELLPPDCQKLVRSDYVELWKLNDSK